MDLGMWWQKILLVASGGALGAIFRFLVGEALLRRFGAGFPWGTLTVNALGSFAAGYLMVWLGTKGQSAQYWRAFLIIGVMGGMTTFSALMMESRVLGPAGPQAGGTP